jgi:hypothetical protein
MLGGADPRRSSRFGTFHTKEVDQRVIKSSIMLKLAPFIYLPRAVCIEQYITIFQ